MPAPDNHPAADGVFEADTAERLAENVPAFNDVTRREKAYKFLAILSDPVTYFRLKPTYTLLWSVPLALVVTIGVLAAGLAPVPSVDATLQQPVLTTAAWVVLPATVALTPVSVFHELQLRRMRQLHREYPEALQKIAAANETGMTMLESLREASTEQGNLINRELELIEKKVALGIPVEEALVEFANAYGDAEISRTTRLLIEAQRASERVSEVLDVAIQSATNRVQIQQNRRSTVKSQVIMLVLMTLVVTTIIVLLNRTVIPMITDDGGFFGGAVSSAADDVGPDFGGGDTVDPEVIRTLLFHLSVQYAALGGVFAGFISTGTFKSGLKWGLAGTLVTVAVWAVVEGGVI